MALWRSGPRHEVLDEAGLPAGSDVQHVVQHQHLARSFRPGADADGGDVQLAGDGGGQGGGNGFQDDQGGACLFQGEGIFPQFAGRLLVPALDPVAA